MIQSTEIWNTAVRLTFDGAKTAITNLECAAPTGNFSVAAASQSENEAVTMFALAPQHWDGRDQDDEPWILADLEIVYDSDSYEPIGFVVRVGPERAVLVASYPSEPNELLVACLKDRGAVAANLKNRPHLSALAALEPAPVEPTPAAPKHVEPEPDASKSAPKKAKKKKAKKGARKPYLAAPEPEPSTRPTTISDSGPEPGSGQGGDVPEDATFNEEGDSLD